MKTDCFSIHPPATSPLHFFIKHVLQTAQHQRVIHYFTLFSLFHIALSPSIFAAFETPGILSAKSLLPAEMIKGPHYAVEDQVQNDGLLNQYTVNSPFGTFKVRSTSSLEILLHEIPAIAEMKKVETDDTAIASLKKSGENTVTGIKNLFNDPQGTAEGAVAGVSSLFNRAKETVGSREVTGAEDSKVEQLIGLSKSKGQIAVKYGVNMYSRNPVLQEELDRLARADYLGGLGIGVATSVVPGVSGLILTTSGTARLLNEAINTTPASELWLQNKKKLQAMGMNEDTVVLYLNNPQFSPALQTIMTSALEKMKTVANRELYLKIALQASDPEMAKIITETAVLTAGYHENIAKLAKLEPLARLASAVKKDGTKVVILPTDYLIWSKNIADAANALDEKKTTGSNTELWLLGGLSATAQKELTARGWQVHTKIRSQIIQK